MTGGHKTMRVMPNDDMDRARWRALADVAGDVPGDLHELSDRVRKVLVVFPPTNPTADFRAYALGWFLSSVLEALELEMKRRDH